MVPGGFVSPDGAEVRAAEAARKPGPARSFRLTATAGKVDLGGLAVDTWSYDGKIPGPPIRVTAGEVVRAPWSTGYPPRRPCTGTASRCATTRTACHT